MTLDDAKVAKASQWLGTLNADLDRGIANLELTKSSEWEGSWTWLQQLQARSAECAAMARLAILRRHPELMKECFDCLKKIEAFYPWIDPVSRIHFHWRILTVFSTCSEDDLKWVAETYSIDSMLSEVTSLEQYRRWVIERGLFVEKKFPFKIPDDGFKMSDGDFADYWEACQRYHLRGVSRVFDGVTWYSALPHAIAKREILLGVSRGILAELELLDDLIAGKSNETIIYPRQDFGRYRVGQLKTASILFSFDSGDLIRYRELRKSVADRVSAN